MTFLIPISLELEHPDLLVGVVQSQNVPRGAADAALAAEIDRAVENRRVPDAAVKAAIRDLLRFGGYKPSGRGKPASEYLAEAAARGEFPRISHIVDALNLVSLESGLPISLLDADRAMEGAEGLAIRFGRAGEKYVFNGSGHEIDLEGLLCVARKDGSALANPVKDSMAAKTVDATTHTLGIIWASRKIMDASQVKQVSERLGDLLRGQESRVSVL